MKKTKSNFCICLNELLKARGLSAAELSRELGVSEPTVSQWRAGKREPSLDMILRIADVLDTSVSRLVVSDSRIIGVVFDDSDSRVYSYRCDIHVKIGDFVLVPVNRAREDKDLIVTTGRVVDLCADSYPYLSSVISVFTGTDVNTASTKIILHKGALRQEDI